MNDLIVNLYTYIAFISLFCNDDAMLITPVGISIMILLNDGQCLYMKSCESDYRGVERNLVKVYDV